MIGKPYRSYVAIGDSLSEGLGDFHFHARREHNGWTDRLANILAREADDIGHQFHYANLALRGSRLAGIMEGQLRAALRLQPDLVSVMAGSNDLMSKVPLSESRDLLRTGILELKAAGCDVLVANTINPTHLKVFKPLLPHAKAFSAMIADVAAELEVPVLDVHGIDTFRNLAYWAEDMVHFSGHGHAKVANQAAEILNLRYRYLEEPLVLSDSSRGIVETLKWVVRDVLPFFQRKLKGVTSGDGLEPKHSQLFPLRTVQDIKSWELISA